MLPEGIYLFSLSYGLTRTLITHERSLDFEDAIGCHSIQYFDTNRSSVVVSPGGYHAEIDRKGIVFMGAMSSEALGDYCAGPNHVLPTAGSARFASPLGVYDFQRRSSVIHVSQAGAQALGWRLCWLKRSRWKLTG